jgi:hypothetical protein
MGGSGLMRLKIVINDNVVKKAENSHCHSEELATRNLKHSLLLYIDNFQEYVQRDPQDGACHASFGRVLTIMMPSLTGKTTR